MADGDGDGVSGVGGKAAALQHEAKSEGSAAHRAELQDVSARLSAVEASHNYIGHNYNTAVGSRGER